MTKGMLTAVLLFLLFGGYVYAQQYPVPADSRCDECGMAVDKDSKFTSGTVDKGGKRLYFCDIGDMLRHFRSAPEKIQSVQVRDYTTGEWIDGKTAHYVLNKGFKTPMMWGVAAFGKGADAKKWGAPVDFDGAFKLVQ